MKLIKKINYNIKKKNDIQRIHYQKYHKHKNHHLHQIERIGYYYYPIGKGEHFIGKNKRMSEIKVKRDYIIIPILIVHEFFKFLFICFFLKILLVHIGIMITMMKIQMIHRSIKLIIIRKRIN